MTNTNISTRTILLATAATLSFALASPASAQEEQQQPPPQQDQSATDVDQAAIVITAQKREEKILDIPQSVTVVGGDTIERQHATTFEDYRNEIPGLSLTQDEPGETRIVLRGVNTNGVSSTVAVYVDETPFGSSSALVNGAVLAGDFDPFDLARIEVLRGPQGTLYGASSLGGVFKFVTNAPQLGEFTARGRAGIEFVDDGGTGYNANAMVNVPLGDIAAFRATGTFRKEAGWVDADPTQVVFPGLKIPPLGIDVPDLVLTSLDDQNVNDNKVWSGRASVLIRPSDPLTIRLTAHAQNMHTHGSAAVDVHPDSLDPVRSDFGQTSFIPEFGDIDYRIYSADIDYDFGFASLLSATSYGKSKSGFRTDTSLLLGPDINLIFGPLNPNFPGLGLPPPITDEGILTWLDQVTEVKKFTQEFRLASPSNDKFEWMVGAYYTHEDGLIDQNVDGLALENPPLTAPFVGLLTTQVDSSYKEIAGFANVTWHVTDRFDISGGARLSHNKQRSDQVVGGTIAPLQFGGFPVFEPGKSSEDVFTYSLSPRYEINDNTAVYARVAKGYRPGGPNAIPPLSPEELATFPTSFDADTLTSYEVGLKTDIGRRMSLDLAAYHLDWNNIQLFGAINNFGFNANGDGASVNGLEGTFTYRPMRGVRLSANGAWTDAQLTDDTPGLVGGQDGDRLPYSPKLAFALNGDYEWNLATSATAFVGASVRWTGGQRGEFRSTLVDIVDGQPVFGPLPQLRIPDYATVDLRAGAEFGRFTVEGYVRNLTNAHGITEIDAPENLPAGAISAAFIRPRTIGFTLGAGF